MKFSAQGRFLNESHGSRVVQGCLPRSNEFILGDPCQLIVLIRPQCELKKIVVRCPISQRLFSIHELSLFESSVHRHAIQMSLGCTDSSASHTEQRRWLAIAGPKAAELEINLKKCSKLCSVPQTMSSATYQDALRTVPMTVHLMEGSGCSKMQQQHQRHQGVHPDQRDLGNPISMLQHESCSTSQNAHSRSKLLTNCNGLGGHVCCLGG